MVHNLHAISLLGKVVFVIFSARKLKSFRGHFFPNAVKITFISDAQYYVPVKLCAAAGSRHLFKITGKLLPEHVKLNKLLLRDITEIY